jgi:predicted permease
VISDLRFAARALWKAPGFSCVAVLTLAVGIGANTAIFSLIDTVFWRGLTFDRPAELFHIYGDAPERNLTQLPLSVPKFEHFRDHQTAFVELAADFFNAFTLTGFGDPVQLNGYQTTSNYFRILGVKPLLGRLFRPDEERAGDHVALISETFWNSRFRRDPGVLGRPLMLDGVPHTIIGVLPPQPLAYFGPTDVWTTRPTEFPGATPELLQRGMSFLRVIGRLAPGVALPQAGQAVVLLARSYKGANGEKADSSWGSVLVSLQDDSVGALRPGLWTLFGAVGFVLLIASSNVANLLLVRFSGRRREVAVRGALGAGRRQLVQLFLLEGVLVSLAAAAIGVLLARGGLDLLPQLTTNLPIGQHVDLSWTVLAFAVTVAIVTGLATGLYPSFQASRADVVEGLKDGGRGSTASRGQHRFRTLLLAGQVALSFVLLVGASLLLVSFARLQRQDTGFTATSVLIGGLNLPPTRYMDLARRRMFLSRLLDELRHTPGVQNAALVMGAPLTGISAQGPYSRADGQVVPYTQRPLGLTRPISPGYFATLGIPLVSGRDFNDHDTETSPIVIIISRSTATRVFPEGGALGRHLIVGSVGGGEDAEIVGIATDVRSNSLAQTNPIEIYRPLAQRSSTFVQLLVKTDATDANTIAPSVRRVLGSLDADLPLIQPGDLLHVISGSIAQERLLMVLLGLFAALAMGLALVGIYSVVASIVGQRGPEIAVRLALGAQPRDVLGLIMRQGLTPVAFGLFMGVAGALALGRLVESQLYATSAFDAMSFTTTATSLLVAAGAACWIPARRASKIRPALALRT